MTASNMEAYAELDKQNRLSLNVKTHLTWKSAWANSHDEELALIEARGSHATDQIDTEFAKIMLDGIPPTYTAALLEPYAPSELHGSDHRGKLMLSPEELKADVIELDKLGLTIMMHATGDRSARVALDAVEAARKTNGDSGLIHAVSPCSAICPILQDKPSLRCCKLYAGNSRR